jgi:N-methylhydantoinase A
MHAAAIAAEMGIETIVCPRASGVLSALGLCASDRRRDTAHTVMLSGAELSSEPIAAAVDELIASAATNPGEARPEVVYEMRYAGQAFELSIPGPVDPDPADLRQRFERAHEERYGHRDPEGEVVLVDIRLAMVVAGPEPRPVAAASGGLEESTRPVHFDGEWIETPVLRGEPAAATRAAGPVVFELPEATLVLPPSWQAEVDDAGTIIARFLGDEMRNKGTTR